MSLPSGYKRLEYIQSSGTQYINTEIIPTNYVNVEVKFQLTESQSVGGIISAEKTWKTAMYSVDAWACRYNTTYKASAFTKDVDYTVRVVGKYFYINDALYFTGNDGDFNGGLPLTLFAVNRTDTPNEYSKSKIYYCKIYNNGILVRDYIAAKRSDGTIGLWDDVNGVFYGNAGTSSFIAGPEIKPDTPENFTSVVSNGVVSLSWGASSGATGYRLSRDGAQISDQTGTTYTETLAKNQSYTYSLVAYNDAGDSAPATLKVTVPLEPPAAPTGLAASVSQGVVSLSWDSTAKATGYRLYRDGTLLADQTGTGYTDNIGAAGEYAYTLIAYNDDGDSPEATLTVTVVLPPSVPAELRMTARTRTTISLAWDAVSGAEGYRLYRGGVQIYSGTVSSYTDTGLSTETPYTYAVEAYNSAGTSSRITLETATTGLILITDRTQQDVDRVWELAKKLNAGTATVEELAEWNSIALKGCYDYTDLNRVGDAVQYLSEILKSRGYDCPVIPKLDWPESGSGSPSDMAQYLQNVQTLRCILTLLPETPDVPADMEKPTWQEANAIEQILADLESTIKTMLKTRVVCGDAYCGGEYL